MSKEKVVKGADSLSATENILWEELKKALTYFNEALLYTDRKRKWSRGVDSLLLFVALEQPSSGNMNLGSLPQPW